MPSRDALHELVNRLPDGEIPSAARYLEFLIAQEEAPIDPAMLDRIDAARAHPSEGISHEEILREFGL